MTYKIDLHIHTKSSGDNYTEPEEAVLHAIESGLHGLAFTEHYFYEAEKNTETASLSSEEWNTHQQMVTA
jgi:histidinol phosphatase-like PHP family hydrolase